MDTTNADAQDSLQDQVEAMWKLDNAEADDLVMSADDRKVIEVWETSTKRDGQRYSLDIPLKNRPPQLPDNKSMAQHRLLLLKRRLERDPDLHERYVEGMSALLQKGYAEPVPPSTQSSTNGDIWYLPHHPVIHPRKAKLRIVFDCAAKYKGISLNSQVHQGPDLTSKLIGVLLKFRQENVAFTADISEMFNQVKVNQPDRDVLRFLWYDDEALTTVREYRMTTHLFGGTWSPSCANYVLKRTARDNQDTYGPTCARTVDQNFYVDDVLISVASEKEAKELACGLRSLLAEGGFKLTKWSSTSREVLKSMPEDEWAKDLQSLDLDHQALPTNRALGVLWNTEEDEFRYDVNMTPKPFTKRGLLSLVSSLYDPLGCASPFTLRAKMLFQELCQRKCDWDKPMPEEIEQQWKRWLDDLPKLQDLKMPRCVKPPEFGNVTSIQLHHFSDASEKGYGATSYLRLKNDQGDIHVTLLMAKAKLAPLKSTTIPRLELVAAVESVKLDHLIRQHLEISLPSTYWTDSTIVLAYLCESKRYKTFVANRVSRILSHSSKQQWRHVDTANNPADDVSRGQTSQELIDNERWINGPTFLQKDEDAWPEQTESPNLPEDAEVKKEAQVYVANQDKSDTPVMERIIARHSDWYKLKKSVAWILRLKEILRCRITNSDCTVPSGSLQVRELHLAEEEIIKHVQKTLGDINSSDYRRLSPQVSDAGIACVGGRLEKAPLSENIKHPWILPNCHPVVDLIVAFYHSRTGHSGVEHTLAKVRQKYWIIKGRTAVKRVVYKCVPCRRKRAPLQTQLMADLPADRVTPGLAPFEVVGLDFFGPFTVRRSRSDLKRYGCLFTCLTTRAIHIEVCQSLDTTSFLNGLERFICRRGRPKEVRSDNGTNLVGGQRELREAIRQWNQGTIEKHLLQQEIR